MKKQIILLTLMVAQSFASLTPRETQIFGQFDHKNLLGVDYAFVEAKNEEVVETFVKFLSVRLISF